MSRRVAILDGVRTPFCRSGGVLKDVPADDLGTVTVCELLARTGVGRERIDEVIFGNVAQPVESANVARVIALKAGLPDDVIAHTVHRNCASGMQSLTAAALQIQTNQADLIVAGGTESMSQIPLLVAAPMTELLMRLSRARSFARRARVLAGIRPAHLKPVIALKLGLTDPVCELNMGQTAEVLAREFGITRDEQDAFALESHQRAVAATNDGRLADEIVPMVIPPRYDRLQSEDDGPRPQQSLEALGRLRPCFDRHAGTVTPGNACQITDGAVAMLLASEERAAELGIRPLGYLTDWSYAALDGRRMGLGPTHATAKLLDRTGLRIDDFDRVEINEAFAAQVIANQRAFASSKYAERCLNRSAAVGEIDPARLNTSGGAIALGHPVGASGTRIILTLLREMQREGLHRGLATLCVGGGQGAAVALEAAA